MIKRIVTDDGIIEYRLNGRLHRPNGPASIEHVAWDWHLYGEWHRYYGPQCRYNTDDPELEWWIHGVYIKT